MTTVDEIWNGDLFNRKEDAVALQAYMESISSRQISREDAHSFTIAVDTPYGVGKTFFLTRLQQHLALNHPVAYIDAWADDMADEPFTALASTLKEALDPLIKQSADVKRGFGKVLSKAGKVAEIVGWGLLKKGVSLAITAGSADEIDKLLKGADENIKDAVKESLKNVGDSAVNGATLVFDSVAQNSLMQDRIEKFDAGKKAVIDLKLGLKQLISSLEDTDKHPPIVIIIDELDRCRPTYAVKLLEEIKHLFDVPGLVFVFGMNGSQLAHSLSGAYGPSFDGAAYLRRFVQRTYRLAEPDLTPLIASLVEKNAIDTDRLFFLPMAGPDGEVLRLSVPEKISMYARAYGLKARDIFQLVDLLQTCLGLTRRSKLLMPYLLPLLISKITGGEKGEMLVPEERNVKWKVVTKRDYRDIYTEKVWNVAAEIRNISLESNREFYERLNSGDELAAAVHQITQNGQTNDNPLANPMNYPDLLETVGRFF